MSASVYRLVSLLAAVAAIALAAPLAASAATTRFASPDGTGTSPCPQAEPCSIETALSNAGAEGLANGDTVLLAPGTYEPVAQLDVFRVGVTVAGEPGKPAPLIEAAGERGLVFGNVGTVRDLRIHSTSAINFGLIVNRPESLVERVGSTGNANIACGFGSAIVRDTVCATANITGTGLSTSISGAAGTGLEPTLYNVTAIGGRIGIEGIANEASVVKTTAFNTIARGGEADVFALSQNPPESSVEILLSHSNFAVTEASVGTVISPPAANANQTAPPLFVDAPGGDYRELASSPTRLAGDLGTVLPGELDLAGNPRTTNCEGTVGVDIGAYQYECPTPETPVVPPKDEKKSEPPPPMGQPLPLPPKRVLSKLTLKPAKFTDTGKAPKGTTIAYTLSAAATVKIDVLGKKTVKGKKKTVTLGSLPHAPGNVGANSVKFGGRLKGTPLEPGRYTLRVAAAGPGGSATPATKAFTVLAATG